MSTTAPTPATPPTSRAIYIICPVRLLTPEQHVQIEQHVQAMERQGHKCHFLPRDVDQSLDVFSICLHHQAAMAAADEVHVWWDPASLGSHFDLGMAFMLRQTPTPPLSPSSDHPATARRPIVRLINPTARTPTKSYTNVLLDMLDPSPASSV